MERFQQPLRQARTQQRELILEGRDPLRAVVCLRHLLTCLSIFVYTKHAGQGSELAASKASSRIAHGRFSRRFVHGNQSEHKAEE